MRHIIPIWENLAHSAYPLRNLTSLHDRYRTSHCISQISFPLLPSLPSPNSLLVSCWLSSLSHSHWDSSLASSLTRYRVIFSARWASFGCVGLRFRIDQVRPIRAVAVTPLESHLGKLVVHGRSLLTLRVVSSCFWHFVDHSIHTPLTLIEQQFSVNNPSGFSSFSSCAVRCHLAWGSPFLLYTYPAQLCPTSGLSFPFLSKCLVWS